MKEEVQNGPLMDQGQRQKVFTLPQIKTVFGTVEEVLEQRTESDIKTNQGRSGVMTEDEISGIVQDALFKARKATESLSPHRRSSGAHKPYSSFFPSLENMMSTSRSTTLQLAQSGKTHAPNNEGQREQPERSLIHETIANSTASEQTGARRALEQTAQSAAMKYAQTKSPKAAMMINPSDYVFRKVEDEIANAKKVAQEAFNRVKGVAASNKDGEGKHQSIVDLTNAEDEPTFDDRETAQFLESSTLRSEGLHSTWRSEGPNSTWKSAEDSEGQLDSMVSEDYGLVYEYSVAPSMSSIGQPSAFCSLDNPIIRVMEDTVAGMNIIDLTNVEAASPPPLRQRGHAQLRAVSPSQHSFVSTGTEENGGLYTIEKTEPSKQSVNKKIPVKSYPVLPVSQVRIVKAVDDSQKTQTEKAAIQTTPVVSMKQESSRVERLRKLKQPINILKVDSRNGSQGISEDQAKASFDVVAESSVNDCVGEEILVEEKDEDETVENEKHVATDQEANSEPGTEKEPEEIFFDPMEAAEAKEEALTTEEEDGTEKNEVDAEAVTDQQVEDALIDSVATDDVIEDSTDQQVEAVLINLVETEDQEAEEAVIDLVETAEVIGDSNKQEAVSHTVEAETQNNITKGPMDLTSGFGMLLSFFQDRDEKRSITLAKSKGVDSEAKAGADSGTQCRDNQKEASAKDVTPQNGEIISDEKKDPTKAEIVSVDEIASVEESTNDICEPSTEYVSLEHDGTVLGENKYAKRSEEVASVKDDDKTTMEELATPINTEEVSNVATVASPNEATAAADVIKELGNFDTSHDDRIQVAMAREDHTNLEREPAINPEVQNDQKETESKHPLLAFFDAAREARARDFAALGLGFMASTKKQPESDATVPQKANGSLKGLGSMASTKTQPESDATVPQKANGSLEGLQFSAAFAKSGESNEQNSLIEAATTTPSMDGHLLPSPAPSQYTTDGEGYFPEPGASRLEDFRCEAEKGQYNHEEPTMSFDPLGSLYRAPVAEKDLEPESTRVSLKNKYGDPPAEYTTRSTEEIINANSVEAPVPQLSVLEPTDDIQKLQTSIMGESVTRRFNACGALKMFATNKSNQLALARTDGFFDALIVALTTDLAGKDREAAFGTRTRALEILLRVCMQKENRVIIFYHPDLIEAIVSCAIENSGEIRMAACSVLAMIAKSGHLREPMAQVEDLLDVLADSLLGADSQKAASSKNLDEVHENEANHASDEFSSESDSSTDDSASESETSYGNISSRNKQHSHSAKLKKKEIEEKKKEIKKQVTSNACAALLHLSKQCAASHFMCHCASLPNALLILSQQFEHPMHTKCLEILCNLTRLPSNDEILAEHPSVVPVMLRLSTSESEEDRVWALRMLQNISASKAGKQVLVSAFALELLSMSVLRTQAEEQKAAMAALFNLSTDPGCLMAITNTRDVISSLVLVAQDMNTISEVRMMACDMLATVGLWFQKLAGGATVPDGVKETALPSNVTTGWNRWE